MNHDVRILHLEDDPHDAELIKMKLEKGGYSCDVVLVQSRDDYSRELREGRFDIILADYTLPSFDGLRALSMARETCPDIPFIFVSGTIGEELAIEALHAGATDYVLKDNLARLEPSARRALQEAEDRKERRQVESLFRESEGRYLSVVENTSLGVSILSPSMEVLALNGQMKRWFPDVDVSRRPVCYQAFISPPRDAVCSYCPTRRTFEDGQVHEAVTDTPAGSEIRHYRILSSPVKDAGGRITAAVEIVEDITERKQAEESLRKSEEHYRSLFENMLNGVAHCQMLFEQGRPRDFVYLSVNGAFEALTGLKDVVGRKVTEIIPGIRESDPELFEIYGRVALTGKPERFERYVKALQMWFWISVYSPQKEHFVAVFDVITDRKRAENELQTAARQWNTTFDAMNDAISIMDDQGTIVRCNKAMLRFVDKSSKDIIKRRCWEVVHPEKGCLPDCPFERMKKTRRRETTTIRLGPRWFAVTADPIIDQEGRLTGGVHIMTDVTERRNFETELRESESKFRILAEQSLVGTYIIQDALFKYVSPRLAEMFGYGVDDIIGRKGPLDLVVPEDHHIVEQNMKRRLAGEVAFSHYEARGRTRTGAIIHIEIFGSVMSYQNRPAIIGVVLDITEKKKLENQLRQAQKMEAVGQLTGGIAHDFNNILSAIIGYGNLLQMKLPAGDPLRLYVDQILAGSDRAANLTRSLLTFSRKQISNPLPMNINECLGRVEKLLRRIISEDIDLRTELSSADLVVNADAGQLEQVMINLATNARDAMPDGGSLTIETRIADADAPGQPASKTGARFALLSVTDTGVGMDEKTRERIFEPFFTTKDLGRGTGLGLSMVYGIIKQHGGRIHCSSEPGRGTTFRIYLPLLVSAGETSEAKTAAAVPEGTLRGTETILVAEDDEALRKLATTTLQTFGYTVIEAVDGEEAIEKFIKHQDTVRLVLCDVIMPRKNGGEVEREIKRLAPRVRIVFMSGYPADVIRQKSLVDDGAEVLLKPMSPTDLLRKVHERLDNKKQDERFSQQHARSG